MSEKVLCVTALNARNSKAFKHAFIPRVKRMRGRASVRESANNQNYATDCRRVRPTTLRLARVD